MSGAHDASMATLQEQRHGQGFDYEPGSPHLRHPRLRHEITERIRSLVAEQFARTGSCRVLEVGAGHGSFTDHIAATGAEVTVTEMSRPSLDLLERRFAWNKKVTLLYDPDGERVFSEPATFDLVLCVSVLHHIPDYIGFVDRVCDRIDEGGAFASFQDRSGISGAAGSTSAPTGGPTTPGASGSATSGTARPPGCAGRAACSTRPMRPTWPSTTWCGRASTTRRWPTCCAGGSTTSRCGATGRPSCPPCRPSARGPGRARPSGSCHATGEAPPASSS